MSHLPLTYDPTRSRRPERLLGVGFLAAVVAAALTGCSGSNAATEPSAPLSESPAAVVLASPGPSTPAAPESLAVDATVWQSRVELTLVDATLDPVAGLTVTAQVKNLGHRDASLADTAVALESGSQTYPMDVSESELPVVPGGSEGEVTFVVPVHDVVDTASAVLTVGSAAGHQVRVPLTPGSSATTNEPVVLDVENRTVRSGSAKVELTAGQVRYDDPLTHREVESGHAILDLTFDVSRLGGANRTTFIGTDNLMLALPDGTSVAVRQDGLSNPGELLAPGATVRDLHVRFEVPDGLGGRYVLRLSSLTPDGAKHWKSVAFTVETA
jgi:hypothetical protein